MLSKQLQVHLYRTLIRKIVMFGCETLILLKSKQNNLFIFERKILRRIFGLCRDEGIGDLRVQKNMELN